MSAPGGKRGRGDAGNVPASVAAGVRPHVGERLGILARHCVRSAECGEKAGAALQILSALAELGIKAGVRA